MARNSRCRVHQDQLWDADGTEWSTTLGRWADADAVSALLTNSVPVVVHGFGRPFRTLTVVEASDFWSRARPHFQVPGQSGAVPDGEGLTYGAQVWARGDDRLLGFVEFC